MSEHAPPPQSPADPGGGPLPLEYAGLAPKRSASESERLTRRFIGATRQVVLAMGLAFALGGLGQSIDDAGDGGSGLGPVAMAFGGALVGLAWPLRRGDRL